MAKQTDNIGTAADVPCACMMCLYTPRKTNCRQTGAQRQLAAGALSAVPTVVLLQKVKGGHAVEQLQASI